MANREDFKRLEEKKAEADLAELAAQGKGMGAGFAEGALKRQKILQESEEIRLYQGAVGNKKATNIGLLILLVVLGGILSWNLITRFI
ncbi:MAG: hypothetical protein R3261_14980 [Alphaproteobacteria bacterium]|nr:hypothetical protein [Alphaproteobacteria bacterium]